jgi:CheY-like chemotaxis protein
LDLAGMLVLIVDDDPRNTFAVTSLLRNHGVEVIEADSGGEAIEMLQSRPETDLVLMDIMMPEMDGYVTIQAIRAMPQVARIPIIALTAKALPEDRERCMNAGASDYVAKPVDVVHLLELLGRWRKSPSASAPADDESLNHN